MEMIVKIKCLFQDSLFTCWKRVILYVLKKIINYIVGLRLILVKLYGLIGVSGTECPLNLSSQDHAHTFTLLTSSTRY